MTKYYRIFLDSSDCSFIVKKEREWPIVFLHGPWFQTMSGDLIAVSHVVRIMPMDGKEEGL